VAQREQRWDNVFPLGKPREGRHKHFPDVMPPLTGSRSCEKIARIGQCGSAACCAESLRLSGKRLSLESLVLSLRCGRAEPFRTADGRAAILSQLLRSVGYAPSHGFRRVGQTMPALTGLD
jgi:hypothetical protein